MQLKLRLQLNGQFLSSALHPNYTGTKNVTFVNKLIPISWTETQATIDQESAEEYSSQVNKLDRQESLCLKRRVWDRSPVEPRKKRSNARLSDGPKKLPTQTQTFLLIKPFAWWRCRCRCLHSLLKLLNFPLNHDFNWRLLTSRDCLCFSC